MTRVCYVNWNARMVEAYLSVLPRHAVAARIATCHPDIRDFLWSECYRPETGMHHYFDGARIWPAC